MVLFPVIYILLSYSLHRTVPDASGERVCRAVSRGAGEGCLPDACVNSLVVEAVQLSLLYSFLPPAVKITFLLSFLFSSCGFSLFFSCLSSLLHLSSFLLLLFIEIFFLLLSCLAITVAFNSTAGLSLVILKLFFFFCHSHFCFCF